METKWERQVLMSPPLVGVIVYLLSFSVSLGPCLARPWWGWGWGRGSRRGQEMTLGRRSRPWPLSRVHVMPQRQP